MSATTPLAFRTPTERQTLVDLLAKAERLTAELSDAYREAQRILTATAPIRPGGPSYHPERMGQVDELRVGDRALFAGGWREVADWHHFGENVMVWFTDPDMDTLLDKGTHAIRIQKRVDEQEQHPSDLPMPEGVTEVEPW